MAGPVIGTKLYVPGLRVGLVSRTRLLELLAGGERARLTLVSAPAGFGKTTLLAHWVHQTTGAGRAVAWVSLDEADDEPASFWTYVVTALKATVDTIGGDLVDLVSAGPAPTDHVLTRLLNELAAAPVDTWLVLDDFHAVGSQDIRDGVAFLLEHLPPNVHVLISTRADPDLPLPRWRVRGELVEIRAADLRFTPEETTAYLAAAGGLDLTVQDVAALEERTEGWIAALQLAALSLRGHPDPGGFIARFAGNDRYVVDYLLEEVLARQPGHVRDFLLQTAVLDRLTGPLCDALTGSDDGAQTLDALERANLFLLPLDHQRQWYRYHQLFVDVVRARVLAEQPDLVPVLHQRASTWYEDHDLGPEAVRHALAAADHDRAAHLMELAVPSIRRHRQEAMLLGWLKLLPDNVIRRSPVLSVYYGFMLMMDGDVEGVEQRLDDADRALAAGPDPAAPWADTDELRTLPATIAVHRASLAQARGDTAAAVRHANRALGLAGPDDHLARGSAAGFLGLAAWAEGDVATALETFTQAVAGLHAAGNLVDELSSTVVLADLWLLSGRPSRARRLYERALEVAETHGDAVARATADLHVGLGELDHEVGAVDAALHHLDATAALRGRAPLTESHYRWFVAMSRVVGATGDTPGALALLGRAQEHYRPGFFPEVRPIPAMRARLWIGAGDLTSASDWATERGVSAADAASHLAEFDHLTLVRLVLARHRDRPDAAALHEVLGLLARLDQAAEDSGRAGSLVEIRMLTALAHDALGDRTQALHHLADAWDRAPEPESHVRLLLDEGPPMVELLREASRRSQTRDHARRLLAHLTSLETTDQARSQQARRDQASFPAGVLSEREVQVLRMLDSDLSGPQIARELFVSHNTLRTHTKHIFTKLDVTNRLAAVRRAHERGLL